MSNLSLQGMLDRDSLDCVPRIRDLILSSEKFEANEMFNWTIHRMCNSIKPIVKMSEQEIKEFEDSLIENFKYYGWYSN